MPLKIEQFPNIYVVILFNFFNIFVGRNTKDKMPAAGHKAKIWWPPIGDNFGFFDNGGSG